MLPIFMQQSHFKLQRRSEERRQEIEDALRNMDKKWGAGRGTIGNREEVVGTFCPTPSPEDAAITRELVAAGKLLGIDLLDHVVIGSGQRYVL